MVCPPFGTFGTYGNYALNVLPSAALSARALILVSGIGDLTQAVPDFDFSNTAHQLAGHATIMLVKDNGRSWYTQPNGWQDLLNALNSTLDDCGATDVTVMGLSMGGFGAFVLAHALPRINRVIALSTRAMLDPNDPYDQRNAQLIQKLHTPRPAQVNTLLRPSCNYTAVFSMDQPEDTVHAFRLDDTRIRRLASLGSHNIAQSIQEKAPNLLADFLVDCMNDLPDPATYGFFDPPPGIDTWAKNFIDTYRR